MKSILNNEPYLSIKRLQRMSPRSFRWPSPKDVNDDIDFDDWLYFFQIFIELQSLLIRSADSFMDIAILNWAIYNLLMSPSRIKVLNPFIKLCKTWRWLLRRFNVGFEWVRYFKVTYYVIIAKVITNFYEVHMSENIMICNVK